MQNLLIYQVDAFTSTLFGGNPAAVVPLAHYLPDSLMQQIAAENNLSETAFVVARGEGDFHIRWFTPTNEVRLCGHATLAAAHVLFAAASKQLDSIQFFTQEAGQLSVKRLGANRYAMDFPLDRVRAATMPRTLVNALRTSPLKVAAGQDDLLVVLSSAEEVKRLRPQFDLLAKIKRRGVIVTAAGKGCDFVSRCFYPRLGIQEDPVTGSAHTLLAAYWSEQLHKTSLSARQLSQRGGSLQCEVAGDRVTLIGEAVLYMSGEIRMAL